MKKTFFILLSGFFISLGSYGFNPDYNYSTTLNSNIEYSNSSVGCTATITVDWEDNNGVCHHTTVRAYASTCSAAHDAAWGAFNAHVRASQE